jgi:ABC-2 type transport system ATP-binding protein
VQVGGCGFDEFSAAARALPGVAACAPEQAEDGLTAAALSVSSENDARPAVFKLAVDRGWTLYEMSLRRNSLEDVFRSLTVGGDDK